MPAPRYGRQGDDGTARRLNLDVGRLWVGGLAAAVVAALLTLVSGVARSATRSGWGRPTGP